MSWFGDLFGGGDEGKNYTQTQATENKWIQLPDYPEATGARGSWWDTLQKWGGQVGYGAIQPNWEDIWRNASQKIRRYFGGGPEGPGLEAKAKANLARRGMSEQPAAETLLQRTGFQEGNLLQDLAVQQATQEAALGEQGRMTWLNSLMQLAGLKPAFASGGSVVNTTKTYDQTQSQPGGFDFLTMASDIFGEGGTGDGGTKQITDMLGNVMAEGDTGIGDIGSGGETEWYKDPKFYLDIAKLLAMFFV